jgi:type IV secretory pathway TrbL component
MDKAKVLVLLEAIGALLYCAYLVDQMMLSDDELYAKILRTFARICRFVAGHVGYAGVIAEREYAKVMELGRMN